MASQRVIFHSMDCTFLQLCVSFQVKINTTKLQMSPSLYLEYIHVIRTSVLTCGGCTRGFAIPGRSITVIWKVHTCIHNAYAYVHNNTNCYFKFNALTRKCIHRMCSYEIMLQSIKTT